MARGSPTSMENPEEILAWYEKGYRFVLWADFEQRNNDRRRCYLLFLGQKDGVFTLQDGQGRLYHVIRFHRIVVVAYQKPRQRTTTKGIKLGQGVVWGVDRAHTLFELIQWAAAHPITIKGSALEP